MKQVSGYEVKAVRCYQDDITDSAPRRDHAPDSRWSCGCCTPRLASRTPGKCHAPRVDLT
ncbi:hypothetical protein J6590_075169 [Homalodisca vitripennis]|nr:hypothetical protein J6590_075169 [Homalodisca vitripennis]